MTDNNTGQIYELIPKIMAEIGAIGKGQENTFDHYKFRGIDDVYNAVQPALVKHGVFCVPRLLDISQEDRQGKDRTMRYTTLQMRYTFYAPDGSHVEVEVPGEAADRSDKSSNKALAAAFKYGIFQLFCIPTEEQARDDADRDSPEIGTAKPAPEGTGREQAQNFLNKPKESPATDSDKRALAQLVGVKMKAKNIAGNSTAITMRIVKQELEKPTLDTKAELKQVTDAINANGYDLETGDKIPNGVGATA